MKYELQSTQVFNKWLSSVDVGSKRRILARFARIENGHFGDFKQIDTHLFELRFFFGGGLRIYYTFRNQQIVLLLAGGDKTSQDTDINHAKQLLKQQE
jgi:putative addiction module killer protein